jgi:hypothetical protein
MANGDENVVNQNTNPVNTYTVDGKVVDIAALKASIKDTKDVSSLGGNVKVMVGNSWTQQDLQAQYEKSYEAARKDAVEKEYDNIYSTAGKVGFSTLTNIAAGLYDFIGAFDLADHRFPTVGGTMDYAMEVATIASGLDKEKIPLKFKDYTWWNIDAVATYSNEANKFLDNNTLFGDGEDNFGNWFTRRASNIREWDRAVNTVNWYDDNNPYTNWLDTVANYGPQIVGSIASTLAIGLATKNVGAAASGFLAGVRGMTIAQQAIRAQAFASTNLGKAANLANTMASAYIMTQSTGMSIAQDVYNASYEKKLFALSPNLESAALSEYDRVKQEGLDKGIGIADATMAAINAKKEYIRKFASENPEYHSSASKSAGTGAEVALKAMAPAFLLNLTMSSAFVKTFVGSAVKNAVTRNIISKSPINLKNAKSVFWEGFQEYGEEGVIENLAEDMGFAAAENRDYTLSDAWQTVSSWKSIAGGLIGFGVGAGTKIGIESIGEIFTEERKKAYQKQQEAIKKQNEIGAAAGQPDLIQQLTAPIQSAKELNNVLTKIQQLESQGKLEEAKEESKKILALQAYDAFESGTTKNLITNWQKIADDDRLKPETRQAAKIAIQEITSMEKDFNESLKYENGKSVFRNRINQKQDTKLAQELKNKIAEKRIEAQAEVALLKQAGKLNLNYDETVQQNKQIEWNKDGTIKEVTAPTTTEKKEIDLELTSKGYVNNIEGVDASKQIEQIKKQVKPYQEFLDLNERLEATEVRIAEANAAYADMTSKENQKNLKYQNMILQEYQSMEADLEKSFGTDKYMKEVDSKILNHYKKKMDPKSFELFRQKAFVNSNNKEKAVKELAEKTQLEEGLKSNEQVKQQAQETKKEIPFTNIPKETKIELVANKLIQGIPLSAEEERFKNSNSIKIDNKKIELEKIKKNEQASNTVTPEEVNEEGTVTDEKVQITGNINAIVESQPTPQTPSVDTKSKFDTLVDKHNPNLNEQQKATLEKELNKEKPNENLIASLLKVKKPAAQEIINQYKLNQEAVESNTDADLINFVNDIKQQIEASGQNQINFDLETEEVVDEFGETTDVLTEKAKAQLELIKRLKASNNTDLNIVPNKSIPNRYKFEIPLSNDPKEDSDAAIEDDLKSFDPKEIDDRLSPEAKNQLKEQVGDYLIALEDELGSEPTFEKFIRDYIVNSSKEQAKILFDTLALGWELNGMPVENYKEVYDKVFRSRKEIANSLMQFAEEQKLVEQESKEQVNKSNLENNTSKKPVETASGDTVFIPVPLLGDAVFRLAYNTTKESGRFVTVEDEDKNLITTIERFEEDDVDNVDKFKNLLRRDKIKSGTQLSVQLNVPNLKTIFIRDRYENGQLKHDENGKPITIEFGEWVKRNVKEKGIDFLNSQLYYDAVPLTVKDVDGNAVAYIHDVSKISTDDTLSAEQKTKQIADLRALRKYLIDTEKKGGTPKIEVTNKSAGLTRKYDDGKPRRIRSIDENAVLAKGIVNEQKEVTHVYVSEGGKAKIISLNEFFDKFKLNDNNRQKALKQLTYGNTVDVRAWSEDGQHHVFTTNFSKLSEELVESIMNALSLGLDNTKRKTLETNLKAKFGINAIPDFINKFIRLTDPSALKPNTSYFEIKDFGRKILFGVKGGEEFVIQTQEDFDKYKDKLIEFLSQQNLNTKNKLVNPTIDSNEFKMGLVDEDGSIIVSALDYFEYSMKDAENDVRLENMGTADNPHFITRFQPNIEFKPVESPNRNSNNYSSPKSETKEENKQLNNLVANTFTDEQLAKEIPNLEAQGFEFIGSTLEEKVADAKRLLSENTNESTEFAKQLDDNLKKKLEQKPVQTSTSQEPNVVQEIERKGIKQTTTVEVKEKEGVTKATFTSTRSDKPGKKITRASYQYNNVQDFEKDYGVTVEDSFPEGINKEDIAQIKIIEERAMTTDSGQQVQAITAIVVDKEGNPFELIIPVNKRKFTSSKPVSQKSNAEAITKTEETQTPLEGFEEFFNIFAESSDADEAIQKLIDNKTITKDCK